MTDRSCSDKLVEVKFSIVVYIDTIKERVYVNFISKTF
jgi:hypothetical protein